MNLRLVSSSSSSDNCMYGTLDYGIFFRLSIITCKELQIIEVLVGLGMIWS